MRQPWRLALAAASLLVGAGCASQTAPAGAASQAASCINPSRIQKQEIVSDQEIRFTLANDEVWVNTLPRRCPNLKFQGGFTWEVRGMQVCSNEQVIHVREDGTPCQLGPFTRATAAAGR